jgi:hypothetical protein
MITEEKPARLLIRRAPPNTLAAPLLQAQFPMLPCKAKPSFPKGWSVGIRAARRCHSGLWSGYCRQITWEVDAHELTQAEISFHALEMRLQVIIAKNIGPLIGARRGSRSLARDPTILTSWHVVAGIAHNSEHALLVTICTHQTNPLLDSPFNVRAWPAISTLRRLCNPHS